MSEVSAEVRKFYADLIDKLPLRGMLEELCFSIYEREFSPFPFIEIPDKDGKIVKRERTEQEKEDLRYMIGKQMIEDAKHAREYSAAASTPDQA
jgi:hypothetical protein